MSIDRLSPDALRARAKEIARRRDPASHWTVIAEVVALVDQGSHYEGWGFRSLRAWSEEDLGLSGQDTGRLLRLWQAVATSGVPVERWRDIPKGRAELVVRALGLGGDPARWIEKAKTAESEDDLRAALERQVGREPWIALEFIVPESTAPLIEAALIQALGEVTESAPATPEVAQAMIRNREIRHRLLEALARTYLEQRHEGAPGGPAPELGR